MLLRIHHSTVRNGEISRETLYIARTTIHNLQVQLIEWLCNISCTNLVYCRAVESRVMYTCMSSFSNGIFVRREYFIRKCKARLSTVAFDF